MRDHGSAADASSIEPDAPFAVCLGASRDGQAWALAALYRRLHAKLLRYLVGRDPALAEVVAERVWDELSDGLRTFDGDETMFTSWAFAVARRQLVKVRTAEPELAASAGGAAALDAATRTALERVARLPEDEADVFLLRTVAGLSVDDVAWIVAKPRPVVRSLQQRAVERLVGQRARTQELVA